MEGKKTPLYEEHVKHGGKIVNYAGWLLPVQYEGLVAEHEAVRNQAGLFDVSHMGAILVSGEDSEAFLDYLLTNDISKMADEQIIYTIMCRASGAVVDDLLVYKYEAKNYLLVVNAANIDKDYDWIVSNKGAYKVDIENQSDETSILALQGPNAEKILQRIVDIDLSDMKKFTLRRNVNLNGVKAMVSRNGYTGEDGFEIYFKNEDAVKLFNDILENGKDFGLKLAGLGSRDTLRFEAMLPLYGQEISEEVNPLEGDLKFFVKLKKNSDFIGKENLTRIWEEGLTRKVVGFELDGRGIPREGYEIEKDGKKIGYVTTGYMAPTVKKPIGNALIDIEQTEIGNEIDIIIRNKKVSAKVRDRKFLNR